MIAGDERDALVHFDVGEQCRQAMRVSDVVAFEFAFKHPQLGGSGNRIAGTHGLNFKDAGFLRDDVAENFNEAIHDGIGRVVELHCSFAPAARVAEPDVAEVREVFLELVIFRAAQIIQFITQRLHLADDISRNFELVGDLVTAFPRETEPAISFVVKLDFLARGREAVIHKEEPV